MLKPRRLTISVSFDKFQNLSEEDIHEKLTSKLTLPLTKICISLFWGIFAVLRLGYFNQNFPQLSYFRPIHPRAGD
jgi:hypothetical protein